MAAAWAPLILVSAASPAASAAAVGLQATSSQQWQGARDAASSDSTPTHAITGECQQGPITPTSLPKGRLRHRRGRSGGGSCAGTLGRKESFGELLPWMEEREGVNLVGPVTGRSYSERVGDEYVMEGVVGRGQSGVVSQCRHKDSGRELACKTVYKAPLVAEDRQGELKREVRAQAGKLGVGGRGEGLWKSEGNVGGRP